MRTLLVSFFALIISFGLIVPDAEAKRFGGGFSFGKSYSTPKRVQPAAPTQQKAAPTGSSAKAAGQPRRSGFGGLMGGLLAGGLLAALFMGGGFDGIQFMDILLIGLLIFAAVKIFSAMKKPSQPQYAGAQHRQASDVSETPETPVYPNDAAAPSAGGFEFAAGELQLPEWFNEQAFIEGAKGHFSHLQKAWDNSDWDDIKTYTTPELLATLQQERAQQADGQKTEVVSVMAELANFIDNGDHVIASINFYGWLKEDSDETTEFSEIWHLRRDMDGADTNWVIVGIQQP
ncbi:TIM44-like domain-containing protein [Amphritea sp. 2_MG-2023]|jgi:predicted lipid-binding transport protein (Tim44 family)|uniref:Tim44 domain-containing protein n=1 Tax=Amphritea TaxID=515417 RepID=UPI001C07BFE1|nr:MULTISPECIES: TIM44-like domain-containing protein [Amphritea]MBU2965416.1 TIM44-like domain-containing protein [Amphritea atlantica]MDO6420706.1 TIM44-like domain-containing protein [Amphritea sp. 2_MG-2023]MDX2422899.1 TIM44-like domain-containing protein [Amphritea sp.]